MNLVASCCTLQCVTKHLGMLDCAILDVTQEIKAWDRGCIKLATFIACALVCTPVHLNTHVSLTLIRVSNSSSPRMASCKWRGVIRFTFRSLEALPASSSTSAVRYSAKKGQESRRAMVGEQDYAEGFAEVGTQVTATRRNQLKTTSDRIYHAPRMAAVYTAAVAPTRPLAVTRDCRARGEGAGSAIGQRCGFEPCLLPSVSQRKSHAMPSRLPRAAGGYWHQYLSCKVEPGGAAGSLRDSFA